MSAEEEREKAARKVRAMAAAGGVSSRPGKHGPGIAVPEGEPEPAATPQQQAQATAVDIALSSPVLQPTSSSTSALPAAYTCDGKNRWPELTWQGVPSNTAELAVFAMNVQPVKEQIFFDWAIAGLDPKLSSLEAGRLPKAAVLGRNGFGKEDYSICPPQGGTETYMFVLYALPKALTPKQGFDPLPLREKVLEISGNAGLMAVSYSRG